MKMIDDAKVERRIGGAPQALNRANFVLHK